MTWLPRLVLLKTMQEAYILAARMLLGGAGYLDRRRAL